MSTIQKSNVVISDYLKNRKHNEAFFLKLRDAILAKCKVLFADHPVVEISITMSAKYQSPRIVVSEQHSYPRSIHRFEEAIVDALHEIGFGSITTKAKETCYIINFEGVIM